MALASFHKHIFTYTTQNVNIAKSSSQTINRISGQLLPHAEATAAKCMGGTILIETGKKLFPIRNPGVKKRMIGVFDTTNNIRGYIDPELFIFMQMSNIIDTPLKSTRSYDAAHIRQILCENIL